MNPSPTTRFDPGRCPLCGQPNHCQRCSPGSDQGPCWCVSVEIPAALLACVPEASRNRACICQECIARFKSEPAMTIPPKPCGGIGLD